MITNDLKDEIDHLLSKDSLSREDAKQAMNKIVSSQVVAEQVAAFLLALRAKSESVDEILGFLDCLKEKSIAIDLDSAAPFTLDEVVDVCGTGGDGLGTFNVSTTVAFVVAGAGQKVAKHGNRSVSSRSGSFDVLEALGIPFETEKEKVIRSIDQNGVSFLFAPAFHPSLKTVSEIRKKLGVYSVFNILGVLLNPLSVKRQLIGVYQDELRQKLAKVLNAQKMTHAMVVHAEDGLDEFSIKALTRVTEINSKKSNEMKIDSSEYSKELGPDYLVGSLAGGSGQENAEILLKILEGERGIKRSTVLLNSAAALWVGGKAKNLSEGILMSVESIDSKRALQVLNRMRSLT